MHRVEQEPSPFEYKTLCLFVFRFGKFLLLSNVLLEQKHLVVHQTIISEPSVSAFLIIRASGCSNVPQLDNNCQKVGERMISAMTSALVLLLVAYDDLVLVQSGETSEL